MSAGKLQAIFCGFDKGERGQIPGHKASGRALYGRRAFVHCQLPLEWHAPFYRYPIRIASVAPGDLHLGYFPILHDTARPFTGVPEMDEALISNWNARVGADDSVYIVGDFSYNGGEAPTQYLSRLNGHLHLIRGNHDTGLNHAERLLDYCDSVTDFLEIDDGGTHILLCHYPILHEKGGYMIHGHIHNQRNHAYEILKTLPRVLNAGVDINFYRPVPLDELVENNRKYYSEEYPELFPVPPRPDRSAPGLMPRKPDFRPLPQRH